MISNDTTLGGVASATNYGSSCDGLALSNVPPVSPLVYVVLGLSVVNPGTDLTVIGMAGCFSYTSLDVGTFGPSVVASGTGTVAFPIPSVPSLSGLVLYGQGISYSGATSLGLAASNGTQLVVGF